MTATVLVANRGEIALRVFRTAKTMGMRTVAVYSSADANAPHVRAADDAVEIGGAAAADSYLRRDVVVEAALRTGATLVHPGYGFLSEDDRFAQACEDAGLRFVGPLASVLRIVGDKASSRGLAMQAGVPVFPGYAGDAQDDATLVAEAQRIGFPLIVKPSGGGGGKGMSVVRAADEIDDALDGARRVARAAFDDDRLILERYIEGPRHVEVQIFADAHGTVLHLGERDCSLQRRHQKVLEEAPAPNLPDAVRDELHRSAVAFARAGGYVGAGTCEFLVSVDGDIGFIEMNARLQVEHPVTEMVTGFDLVELQLRTALGEPLTITQDDVRVDGHAMEVRVYAEDPRTGFVPQAGRIEHVRWPDGVRVDGWIETGAEVSTHYDPLLAKLIVHAPDRAAALAELDDALEHSEILGPRTNLPFLVGVIADPVVREGRVTTDWLGVQDLTRFLPDGDVSDAAWRAAASAEARRLRARSSRDPFVSLGAWRPVGDGSTLVVLHDADEERAVRADANGTGTAVRVGQRWLVWAEGDQHELSIGPAQRRLTSGPARVDSPLPGRVIDVRVAVGDQVAEGAELIVIEAMKMEHTITAPGPSVVRAVLCAAGDQVTRGQALIDLEPA